MNDITALMATMKATAEKAKHAGEAPVMPFDTRITALNEFQLSACPANVLALVEALENAQQTEKTIKSRNRRLEGIISVAEQRIAELESRTVTVKLPKVSDDAFWLSAYGRLVFREETYRSAVINAICDAGIQVIEGGA